MAKEKRQNAHSSLIDDVVCPVCGSPASLIGMLPAVPWFAGIMLEEPIPGGKLYRCATCSLKFRFPIPTMWELEQLYDNSNTTAWQSKERRLDWERIKSYVNEVLPHGGRVLDFGCYNGGLLQTLGTRYQRHGVEINYSAAEVAIRRGAATAIWQKSKDIPEEMRFDIIIATDVIEHVVNPESFLMDLSSMLDKEGILILTTGDAENPLWNLFGANWWYCFIPEHISFISEAWLNYFCGKHLFTIRKIEKFKYRRFRPARYCLELAMMILYGLLPRLYLRILSFAKGILGRSVNIFPRGQGISEDHLFIVMCPKRKR